MTRRRSEIAAAFQRVIDELPIRRWKRSPVLVPGAAAIACILLTAVNPARTQALAGMWRLVSFTGPAPMERILPLQRTGIVPVGFAAATLWTVAIAGVARIVLHFISRRQWRVSLYAAGVLFAMVVTGGFIWITGMQLLLARRWGADFVQIAAVGVFGFAYVLAAFAAMRFWSRDMDLRCPVCLRLPGLPDARGKVHDLVVDPREIESICMHGHGYAVESRWRRGFGFNVSG